MIAVMALLLAAGEVPAIPAPTTPPTTAAPVATTQALFDSASAAVDGGRCADALRDFTALEAQGRRSPAVTAVIALRKGRCLAELGQSAAAEPMLTAGLAAIPATDVFVADRFVALIARGRIAYLRFDYPAAARDFAAARALAAPADRFEALVWLARATMFDDGTVARDAADEALALAAAPGIKPAVAAGARTLHARILLNHGDAKGGYAELKKALDAEGGLRLTVNAAAIETRSDLALAALLNNSPDKAREYLAYTGAGHGTPFGRADDMDPAPCDGGDLVPGDSAVVEFGLAADGSVAYVTPIYASRLGGTAAAFARAVADWSWNPAALKNIAPLFRAVTRVELRCSTASARPPVKAALRGDLEAWLRGAGLARFRPAGSAAAGVAALRAEIARRRASGATVGLVPVLVTIGTNPVVPADEQSAALSEAAAIAARSDAPVAATTFLDLLAADAAAGCGDRKTFRLRIAVYRTTVRALLATPAVAADPRSRAVVRLALAEDFVRLPPVPDAGALLRAVADDPALPPDDALRSGARLRLASQFVRAGDVAAARLEFAAAHVDAQQCALVDARPVATRTDASSNDFPREVQRWGFEGWVRLEFDVAADGAVADPRAIIAYPPFTFGPAATATARKWRYQQSFRPNGVAGCGGAHQTIAYKIG